MDPETTETKKEIPVVLKGNRVGTSYQSYNLVYTYNKDAQQALGKDRYIEIYIRTKSEKSENIYRLDSKRRLINSRESKKNGKMAVLELSDDELLRNIRVGGKFSYFENGIPY